LEIDSIALCKNYKSPIQVWGEFVPVWSSRSFFCTEIKPEEEDLAFLNSLVPNWHGVCFKSLLFAERGGPCWTPEYASKGSSRES
jgi:hypothetical protein